MKTKVWEVKMGDMEFPSASTSTKNVRAKTLDGLARETAATAASISQAKPGKRSIELTRLGR